MLNCPSRTKVLFGYWRPNHCQRSVKRDSVICVGSSVHCRMSMYPHGARLTTDRSLSLRGWTTFNGNGASARRTAGSINEVSARALFVQRAIASQESGMAFTSLAGLGMELIYSKPLALILSSRILITYFPYLFSSRLLP